MCVCVPSLLNLNTPPSTWGHPSPLTYPDPRWVSGAAARREGLTEGVGEAAGSQHSPGQTAAVGRPQDAWKPGREEDSRGQGHHNPSVTWPSLPTGNRGLPEGSLPSGGFSPSCPSWTQAEGVRG